MTLSEIAAALGVERSGIISGHLSELETAGFITEDAGLNPATGKPAKCVRYRISDNYTRFYRRGKSVEPRTTSGAGRYISSGGSDGSAMRSSSRLNASCAICALGW